MSQRVVIVGAGLAASRVVAGLELQGFSGTITVIGEEAHLPYDRPPLSKQFLAGAVERESLFYTPGEAEVEWKLGSAAVSLDLQSRQVGLDGGEGVGYDRLIIATGRRARPWPGSTPASGVFVLRTLDDSRALAEAVAAGGAGLRVAIIGAGFIGSEAAATVRGLGVDRVSLIDVAPAPIIPLGPEIGRRVADAHREHGVELYLDHAVAEIRGTDGVEGVELDDGTLIAADVVLVAMGSIPNTEWTEGSGLELQRGSVLCDHHLFAIGHDDVLAVGDVAAWPDPAGEGHLSVEHWTNAREMASIAARNIVAEPTDRELYTGIPTFWSDIYDLKVKSAGTVAGADRIAIVEELPEKRALVAEAYVGADLVGAVTINRNRKMIDYTRGFLTQAAERAGKTPA